jgi:hypothetical protein
LHFGRTGAEIFSDRARFRFSNRSREKISEKKSLREKKENRILALAAHGTALARLHFEAEEHSPVTGTG